MLLTAQRVRTPDGAREGINAFCRLHGPYDWFGEAPAGIGHGEIVSSALSVQPAGNNVRSYIDRSCGPTIGAQVVHPPVPPVHRRGTDTPPVRRHREDLGSSEKSATAPSGSFRFWDGLLAFGAAPGSAAAFARRPFFGGSFCAASAAAFSG